MWITTEDPPVRGQIIGPDDLQALTVHWNRHHLNGHSRVIGYLRTAKQFSRDASLGLTNQKSVNTTDNYHDSLAHWNCDTAAR